MNEVLLPTLSVITGTPNPVEAALETNDLLHLIVDTAEEFKASDLTVLGVSKVCGFADYFVIMTGHSITQIQSLTEELGSRAKHAGRQPFSTEGLRAGEWCLLDFGDIVVHVFHPRKRAYYDLEGFWCEAEVVRRDADRGAP